MRKNKKKESKIIVDPISQKNTLHVPRRKDKDVKMLLGTPKKITFEDGKRPHASLEAGNSY